MLTQNESLFLRSVNMSEITLTFCVQGEGQSCSVILDETDTIENLRAAILTRKKKSLSAIDINNFKLWKVSVPRSEKAKLQEPAAYTPRETMY